MFFKNNWVRFARADKAVALQYYHQSSADTNDVEILLSFTHCRWMNTSIARQESATLSFVHLQNYRWTPHRCCCGLLAAKFHGLKLAPLSYYRSKFLVNFADVCGFNTINSRAPRKCSRFFGWFGFPYTDVLDSVYIPHSLRTRTYVLLYQNFDENNNTQQIQTALQYAYNAPVRIYCIWYVLTVCDIKLCFCCR